MYLLEREGACQLEPLNEVFEEEEENIENSDDDGLHMMVRNHKYKDIYAHFLDDKRILLGCLNQLNFQKIIYDFTVAALVKSL